MQPVQVSFLGTGDAFSASGRHQAGYLIRAGGTSFLLDVGASTLTSMKQHGVDPGAIDLILVSHLHGDHFAGLPYLFLQYIYEQPRRRPLRIAGPAGTEERVWALYRATYRDLAAEPLPFKLEFMEMPPGTPVSLGAVRVEPFRVPHQEHDISLGLRVHVGGRAVLYSGDTGWTEALVERSQDTDLFICECCFFETRIPIHLDYPRIAEERHRFGTKRLILTHFGREVHARRNEIEVEMASDGLTIEL
ncbi:MAG: MBL fold metallo-hydrolase [Candidatus Binatia bacterium]